MIRTSDPKMDITMPVAAEYGILSGATTVKTVNSDHWISGFTHEVSDSNTSVELARILGGTEVEQILASPNGKTMLSYQPFMIRTKVDGSTFGSDLGRFKELARENLDLVKQMAVETEFWSGAISKKIIEDQNVSALDHSTTNRYLASSLATDVTPVAGTGVKPRYAQALLEEALVSSNLGYQGLIHTPRAVASVLKIKEGRGGALRTNLGTPVVAGAGYSKQGPDGTDAASGKYWMYATGPVTVILGEDAVFPDTHAQAVNARNNTIEYFAELPAAVVWSTQHVYAVLVDLSLDYQ